MGEGGSPLPAHKEMHKEINESSKEIEEKERQKQKQNITIRNKTNNQKRYKDSFRISVICERTYLSLSQLLNPRAYFYPYQFLNLHRY